MSETKTPARRPLPKCSVEAALLAVMRAVHAVGKATANEDGTFYYRSVDDVVDAVGPALREHGVLCLPNVLSSEHVIMAGRGETGRVQMQQAIVKMSYTFIGPDGSTLVCSTEGEAIDYSDHATSKAQSVAYRIALCQALNIPTGDQDPSATSPRLPVPDEDPVEPAPDEPAPKPEPEPRPPRPEANEFQWRLDALPEADRDRLLAKMSRTAGRELSAVADHCGNMSWVRLWSQALDEMEAFVAAETDHPDPA